MKRSKEGGQRLEKRGRRICGFQIPSLEWLSPRTRSGDPSRASELPAAAQPRCSLPLGGQPGSHTMDFLGAPRPQGPAGGREREETCQPRWEMGGRIPVGEEQTNKLHQGPVRSPPIPLLSTAVYFGFRSLFTLLFGTEPPEHANTIFV